MQLLTVILTAVSLLNTGDTCSLKAKSCQTVDTACYFDHECCPGLVCDWPKLFGRYIGNCIINKEL
ncbi:hypothetical protein BOX15_Mlig014600g1 [Macrostomum lignano]|uniref:Uncharacterized protein n=1 Tax=Macrostomum lignano TaxID=282301 RepID=A0A267EQN2_9PLAT|nr:hypothetical protein BOX15_Mlig014600g3 [Macrostomum lignano]PAA62317.1 hypothetical protein BOX15_Mlig014600g2 [Macrostomum lignano]PAA63187.1 hypothetical protein BOX15_Mlig014600g1 [Macrostomum lignano]